MKVFFPQNSVSSSYFLIFFKNQNFKNFLIFSQKNLTNKVERHFYEMVLIDTLSAKVALIRDFLKKIHGFFSKKPIYFLKSLTFFRFNKSYYFSRILWQICYNLAKKFHFQKRGQKSFNVNAIGTHQVRKNVPFERKVFPPYFMNTVENNN